MNHTRTNRRPSFPRSPVEHHDRQTAFWTHLIVTFIALVAAVRFSLYQPLSPLWIPVAFALTVLLHEIGHLLAGWWRGLTFVRIRVGPLELSRTGLQWVPMNGTVGWAQMACPAGGGHVVAWQWFYAGPAILTLVCLGINVLAQGWVSEGPQAFLKVWAAFMVWDLLVNLWPTGTGSSDGNMLWRLRARSPEREPVGWMIRLSATPADRVPPGGWTLEQVQPLVQPSHDPETELSLSSCLLEYRANKGLDVNAELARLEAVRVYLPPKGYLLAFTDMMLAFGWARAGDAERAARYLQTGDIKDVRLKSRVLLDRAFLAVAVAQQQPDEVYRRAAEARLSASDAYDMAWINRFVEEAEAEERGIVGLVDANTASSGPVDPAALATASGS